MEIYRGATGRLALVGTQAASVVMGDYRGATERLTLVGTQAAYSHARPLPPTPPSFPPPHPRGRRSAVCRCRVVSVCVRGGARGPLPRFSQPRRGRGNQARPPIEGGRSCGPDEKCDVGHVAGVLTAPRAKARWAVRPRARGRASCGVRSRPGSPAAFGGLPVATRPPRARGRGVPPGARSAPALAGVARRRGRCRPRTLPLGRAATRRQRPRVPARPALLGSAPNGAEPAAAALTAASLAPRLAPDHAAPGGECERPVVGRGARPRRSGSAATLPPPSAARLVAVPVCFCRGPCAADAAPLFSFVAVPAPLTRRLFFLLSWFLRS